MEQIPLTQGQFAFVDDEDFNRLRHFRWCYRAEREGQQGYAVRHTKIDGKYKTCYLHRDIMNPGPGMEVIFRNFDKLDCRRENLRVVTTGQARRHHRVRRDSKSGLKGVKYDEETGRWQANVYRKGKCIYVGSFTTREGAAEGYEEALQDLDPELFAALS
jgi:hypothetical protein